jgi:putative endonuclease
MRGPGANASPLPLWERVRERGVNWLCYILRCADDTLYTGITNDLEKRLAAHNAGTAAKYTRTRRPVVLVFAEDCADRSVAAKRELAIKNLTRAEKLVLIQSGQS